LKARTKGGPTKCVSFYPRRRPPQKYAQGLHDSGRAADSEIPGYKRNARAQRVQSNANSRGVT